MSYRMNLVSSSLRIGVSDDFYDVEIWTPGYGEPEAAMEQIIIPAEHAEEIAMFIIRGRS